MSLFRKSTTVQPFTNLSYPSPPLRGSLVIGQDSALSLAAVYACVRYISETVAALPVHLHRRAGDRREQLPDPAWLVKPNPETTRFELFERTVASLNLDGNAFWWFEHDRMGRIAEVWPLHPSTVTVSRDPRTRDVRYQVSGDQSFYDVSNVLHIRAFSGSGSLRGLSPIGLFREGVLALTQSAQEYGGAFFANGASPGGVIEYPGDPSDPSLKRIAAQWREAHQGVGKAHEPGVLTGGAAWKPVTVPNDQAQFLDTRKFQTTEIARIFRVPPHKIADLERATFSNVEHQAIEAVTDCIMPWTARLENAAGPLLPGDAYLKFNLNGLLRGDTLSRFTAYNMGINGSWLNADEVRSWEDMDPIPDGAGKVFRAALNTEAVNGPDAGPDLATRMAAALQLIGTGTDPITAYAAVGLDPTTADGLLPTTTQEVPA